MGIVSSHSTVILRRAVRRSENLDLPKTGGNGVIRAKLKLFSMIPNFLVKLPSVSADPKSVRYIVHKFSWHENHS